MTSLSINDPQAAVLWLVVTVITFLLWATRRVDGGALARAVAAMTALAAVVLWLSLSIYMLVHLAVRA